MFANDGLGSAAVVLALANPRLGLEGRLEVSTHGTLQGFLGSAHAIHG